MKKNLTIASIIIAIIFGIIFLPKIYNRINSESIVDSSRTEEVSNDAKSVSYTHLTLPTIDRV